MNDDELVQIIFEDRNVAEAILEDNGNTKHERILEIGLSTQTFLHLDYKGEEHQEIIHFILDYESNKDLELVAADELEELDDLEYEQIGEQGEISADRANERRTYTA